MEGFLCMKRPQVLAAVQEGLEARADPLQILGACRQAMEQVGKRFESGEFYLSELIHAAEVFKAVSALLEPRLAAGSGSADTSGRVVFGTPRGDIHDLGKNIVITLMRAHGFSVHDLGVDVAPERFVEAVQETGASIVALSALITPAFAAMRETLNLLEERNLRERVFVIIGGGVTTPFAQKELGADAQTLDPTEAIHLCRNALKGG